MVSAKGYLAIDISVLPREMHFTHDRLAEMDGWLAAGDWAAGSSLLALMS